MARTFLTIQNEVLAEDFDATVYRTRAKQAILDGLDDISRNVSLPLLEATWTPTIIAGTKTYALPVDSVRVRSAYFADSSLGLVESTPEELDRFTSSSLSGRPLYYAIIGNAITLSPTPNAGTALRIRYSKGAPDLADTDLVNTVLPEEYVDAVVAFARHRLFRLEDDAEMSNFWWTEYERWLKRMKADLQRRSQMRARQVPGMFYRPAAFLRG